METSEKLNIYFKKLRKIDSQLLDFFDDANIPDDEYFKYGIYSDIVTNGISIITNLIKSNNASIGVDNCCRAELEALTILAMDKSGKIKDDSKHLYRHLYTAVEETNLKLGDKRNQMDLRTQEVRKNDRDELYKAACTRYHCTMKQLKKDHRILKDPYAYLAKSLDDNVSFFNILRRYKMYNDFDHDLYKLFSISIHPRFEYDKDIEEHILDLRDKNIYKVVDMIISFVDSEFSDLEFDDMPALEDEFKLHPQVYTIVNQLTHSVHDLYDFVGTKYGIALPYFIRKASYLLTDMIYCQFIGTDEMVVNKFKSFIEYFCVTARLSFFADDKENHSEATCYALASRLQFNRLLKEKDKINSEETLSELQSLYDDYYKEKYGIDKFEDFYNLLDDSNDAAINKEGISYKGFVNDFLKEHLSEDAEDLLMLYNVSLDMEHASGQNFNQSEYMGPIESKITIYLCLFLYIYIIKWLKDDDYYSLEKTANAFMSLNGLVAYFQEWAKETSDDAKKDAEKANELYKKYLEKQNN